MGLLRSRRIGSQQMTANKAGRCGQLVECLSQMVAQSFVAIVFGRQTQCCHETGRGAAEAFQHPALAAHHVAVMRHHFRRPGRGIVQPLPIRR